MTAPTITILSALQRTDGSFLVDIDFEVADIDLDSLTINLVEFDNGAGFLTTTPQTFDRQHTAVSPLTGITAVPKTFRFVWNAFTDLVEGNFEDIDFKIEIDDGVTPVSDIFTPVTVNTISLDTEEEVRDARLRRRKFVDRRSKDFLGFGLVIPFERGSSDFKSAGGVELVKSGIRQLLRTRGQGPDGMLGELPWRPDFGTAIEELRHLPNDDYLIEEAYEFITEALERTDFEPRIEILDIEAEVKNQTLSLNIAFTIISKNIPENQVVLADDIHIIEVGGI